MVHAFTSRLPSNIQGVVSDLASSNSKKILCLQRVGQQLVHLGDFRGHAQVDGPVANFNNEASNNFRVDLLGDLELLSLAEFGLADGGFESLDRLAVEFLQRVRYSSPVSTFSDPPYLRTGDDHLKLALGGANQSLKLLANAGEYAKTVVLGQSLEEVLHSAAFIRTTGVLLELSNDLRLVAGRQAGSVEDGAESCILLEDFAEALKSL